MTKRQQLEDACADLGVELVINRGNDREAGNELTAEAPHGKVWASDGIHELVESGDSSVAMDELYESMLVRVEMGLADCDDDECEWCGEDGAA